MVYGDPFDTDARDPNPYPKVLWARAYNPNEEDAPAPQATFIGQEDAKAQLAPFMDRVRPFPHTLIKGEPGLGKTQLARWVAYQRKESFKELMCPIKPRQLPKQGIVLLDEVHRQGNPEWLYPGMETGVPTILAATTRPDKMDGPFRSRFFIQIHLDRYRQEEMEVIIADIADGATAEEIAILAKASAGSPRQAHRLVETAKGLETYDATTVLSAARITADGFTEDHNRYLTALKAVNRAAGVGQIAVLMYSNEDEVKNLERFLLSRGMIELQNGGRALTSHGKKYLQQVLGQ